MGLYSHSTATASKAAGQKYGTAKFAKLVVVKMRALNLIEQANVFEIMWNDIQSQGREQRSVVTMSIGSTNPVDPNNLSRLRQKQKDDIKVLLDNNVPVVLSSGNDAREEDKDGKKRTNIDLAPAIFEGPDFPLIVIGATDNTGQTAGFSQGGDHLTMSAPGVNVRCQYRDNDDPHSRSGTSYGRFKPRSFEIPCHTESAPVQLPCLLWRKRMGIQLSYWTSASRTQRGLTDIVNSSTHGRRCTGKLPRLRYYTFCNNQQKPSNRG